MKPDTTNSRVSILGNSRKPDQEVFSSVLKRWQQRFGYWSIFAAVPAVLVSQVHATPAVEGKQSEVKITGMEARQNRKLSRSESTRSLLKRQSRFRLPSQNGGYGSLTPLGDLDDCPGRAIPAGTYTSAAPYTESGDTTGANNTVNSFYMYSFGYQTVSSPGPDHIYSFILTGRGANPKIEVSTTSPTFSPVIYLLQGGSPDGCPAGTGSFAWNGLMYSTSLGTATINSELMNWVPLNVPLYLVIDSGTLNAGSTYTLKMQDVTIAPPVINAIDNPNFFVRQHYLDFLNRAPEQQGLAAWLRVLGDCPAGDQECLHQARLTASAAFFGSPEFQLKGYFVFRFYMVAFGELPETAEILTDMWNVSGQTSAEVYARKATFVDVFVHRAKFINQLGALSNAEFVNTLLSRYQLTAITTPDPTNPDGPATRWLTAGDLTSMLNAGILKRGQVLRAIADSDEVFHLEFKRAFVAMQYYGYLRRKPEPDGYNAWLNYLNAHPTDFREMVRGFMDSPEYRRRFGTP